MAKKKRVLRVAKDANLAAQRTQRILQQEKTMLACELHDGLAQNIVGAKMMAEVFLGNHPRFRSELQQMCDELEKALVEARRVIRDLRPLELKEGLVEAVTSLADEYRRHKALIVEVLVAPGFPGLEPNTESSLFRIIQESLTNVEHHARCRSARVRLSQSRSAVLVEIADSGVGFDPKLVSRDRYGLAGIRDRVAAMDGQVVVRSRPGKGTTITVRLPKPS